MIRRIQVSVNPNIFNKTPNNTRKDWSTGFDKHELTIEELSEVINFGFAFSYVFKNGLRSTKNFISADILCVDMDGTRTVEDTLDDDIVKKYGTLFYTTPSHTPDQHRFRIIFVLPRTITDIVELKQSMTALSRRLGGDMSVIDGGRLFFGSHNSKPTILGNSISSTYLWELIKDGKVAVESESKSYTGLTTNRSALKLDMDTEVMSHSGEQLVLKNVKTKTSIHCPFHSDTNPSGFVSFTQQGYMYLHCSKCKLTWYENVPDIEYNFNDFEDAVVRFKDQKLARRVRNDRLQGLEKFVNYYEGQIFANKKNIQVVNEKYISIDKVEDGLTIVKSPKGSGKTTFLRKVVHDQINLYKSFEEYEEQTWGEGEVRITSDIKVVLLGHRQSLIGDLCKKLGLNNYLDDPKFRASEIVHRKNRYGVCVDSLYKVKGHKYDVVVIDEVEQVLGHFLSGTIGGNGISLFNVFSQLITNAKKIIVLDSDISWITFNTITSIIDQAGDSLLRLNIYINQFKPDNREINIYPSDKQLIGHIKNSIVSGKRVFITSNSKTKVKNINNILNKISKDLDINIPSILITSENSRSDDIQEFIKDIKTKILDYQAILSSPSLGTGIDITFDNDNQHIDCVYGLFENQINSHFEIDQQLSRVRHPKEVNVWISPRRFNFETEFDVITDDHLQNNLKEMIENQFGIHIDSIEHQVSPFYVMSSMIISHQRHSKNNLKNNFIKYKRDQGWSVVFIDKDNNLSKSGGQLYAEGKEISLTENVVNILSAGVFNEYQYQRFKDRVSVLNLPTPKHLWNYYYRTGIEVFYRTEVSEELIKLDNNGQLRGRIRRFEYITSDINLDMLESNTVGENESIKDQLTKVKTVKDFHTGAKLLYALLSSTPLFERGVFDTKILITTNDLDSFSKLSIEYKAFIETQLEIQVRKDITNKPIQHLNNLLKLLGFKLGKPTTKRKKGQKYYQYRIESSSFNLVSGYAKKRKKILNGWDFLNSLHGVETTDIEQQWLYPVMADGAAGSHDPYNNPHEWIKPFTAGGG